MRRRIQIPVLRDADAGDILRQHGVSARMLSELKKLPDGILLDYAPCRSIDRAVVGQTLTITFPHETNPAHCSDRKVPVLYEDEDYIVYDKPPFMPVHRSAGHGNDTLENISPADCGFHVINRLDRDTSGICLVAKHSFAVTRADKVYTALCCGSIDRPMRIDMPIAREEGLLMRRTVSEDGQRAVTFVKPVMQAGGYTFVSVSLLTGRTHQIRVHMSAVGHPLAGDTMYGGDTSMPRHALHCSELSFTHRVTGERIRITSGLPDDFIKIDNITAP